MNFRKLFRNKRPTPEEYIYTITKKTKIKFCSEKELRNMGFIVGCICPFSYSVLKNEYKIELLYDPTINHLTCDLVYTYSGGNNMTFELRREELNDYLKASGASSYRME